MVNLEDARIAMADVAFWKPRDIGATWMVNYDFYWHWAFHNQSQIGWVSRNEAAVDNPGDSDALMQKLDFIAEHLPSWLVPANNRTHLKMVNKENGSAIVGYPATGDIARGGRKMLLGMDELAAFRVGEDQAAMDSSQFVTDCRVFISSSRRRGGDVFRKIVSDKTNSVRLIELDWFDCPPKRRGLYTSKDGLLQILDSEYKFPDNYPFILDGRKRSIYYDQEWNSPGATPRSIACELDRDLGGLGVRFFDLVWVEQKMKLTRDPLLTGTLTVDAEAIKVTGFNKRDGGYLKLWVPLDSWGNPPESDYAIAGDIAQGTGGDNSSNSVLWVIDIATGRQVAELASHTIPPKKLARLAVAMGRWFRNANGTVALLGWERNGGAGSTFTQEVMRLEYGNIVYQEVPDLDHEKTTQKPGFWTKDADAKQSLFDEWERAIDAGEIEVLSAATMEECKQYEFRDGKLANSLAEDTEDDSSKKNSHGDRVIAAAYAWRCCRGMAKPANKKTEVEKERDYMNDPPYGTMAWRLKQREEEASLAGDGWE